MSTIELLAEESGGLGLAKRPTAYRAPPAEARALFKYTPGRGFVPAITALIVNDGGRLNLHQEFRHRQRLNAD